MATVTKSVKLPAELAHALKHHARQSRKSESELIREGILRVLDQDAGWDMQPLIGADVGIGSGPADLSENRSHLAGYGRARDR